MLCRSAVEAAIPDVEPAAIITDWTAASDLSDFAGRHGVLHTRLEAAPKADFEAALDRALATACPDLVVLTFDRIIPPDLVNTYDGRMLNVHPALLPAFAGRDAIERTVDSQARFGGATVHVVTAQVDAGPIVAQVVVPKTPEDDVASYGRRLYAHLEPMVLDVIRWYAEGRVRRSGDGAVLVEGGRYDLTPQSPVAP
jgi:phosphoribosylglycinamide formyltransferase-1